MNRPTNETPANRMMTLAIWVSPATVLRKAPIFGRVSPAAIFCLALAEESKERAEARELSAEEDLWVRR